MLSIHEYANNGLNPNISLFHIREEARIVIAELIKTELNLITTFFKPKDEGKEVAEKI
jgi:hypothetical protein